MNAVRFGSYSRRSTLPGASYLRRRKSTLRYACLAPPPMWRDVMRPSLLRPPVFVLPSTSVLTGLPFHSVDLSTWIRWRRPGDVGLYVLSAMVRYPSEPCRHVDRLPVFERHDSSLRIAQQGFDAFERSL